VVAYLYPEKYSKDWTEQFSVERMLDLESVSAEAFANERMEQVKKRSPNAKHKVLVKDDTSITFASEIPIGTEGRALYKLTRVLKGPKDIHQITYIIRGNERPDMATQKKWLDLFQKAVLKPVKK